MLVHSLAQQRHMQHSIKYQHALFSSWLPEYAARAASKPLITHAVRSTQREQACSIIPVDDDDDDVERNGAPDARQGFVGDVISAHMRGTTTSKRVYM